MGLLLLFGFRVLPSDLVDFRVCIMVFGVALALFPFRVWIWVFATLLRVSGVPLILASCFVFSGRVSG